MESIEIEAKTVEEAINKALEAMNTSRDQVEVVVLREEKKGLFGMPGAIPVKVRVIKKK